MPSAAGCLTLSGLSRELQEMFLPAGYPDSVSEDYLSFQFWDTLQAMCSYLRGVLATQSVLQSVGVGTTRPRRWPPRCSGCCATARA